MFEYLMPLLFMRTLPRDAARPVRAAWPCARQIEYGRALGVPWGISESAYNRRRPPRQLPVQGVRRARPRAQARARATSSSSRPTRRRSAALVDPQAAVANLQPPRGARALAGALRLLRGDRLHAARAGRGRAGATRAAPRRAPAASCKRLPRAPPGHEPGRARQRAAGRRDGRALPRRPARPGHRAAAAGARAAPRARSPSRARPRRRAWRRPSPPRAPRALPLAAHAVPARAVPLERRLHGRRHQRGRRRRASAAAGRSRAGARTRRATRAASSSTCATCAAARSGRRPTSRRPASPTSTWSTFLAEKADLPPPRRRHRDAARGRGLARGRRRGAAALAHQPRRPAARDRGDELRRDRRSAPPADDLAHPAFGKLFLETE